MPVTHPVLVVGATGILAPAVRTLVRSGRDVLAVARTAARLSALHADLGEPVRPLAADASDRTFVDKLTEALAGSGPGDPRLGAALLYEPAVGNETIEAAADLAHGPVVLVLTSGVAAPAGPSAEWQVSDLPQAPHGVRRLVLGWRSDRTWHAPSEVSAAAVALLAGDSRRDAVLGAVHPWTERPR